MIKVDSPHNQYCLASFATKSCSVKDRLYCEEDFSTIAVAKFLPKAPDFNDDFLIDHFRVVASNSFRRLQYKTQVFVNHEGDHYRTRLTHSLEVAHIARQIATSLNLNSTLAEVISLAHDIGHAPFGHAGETALQNKLKEISDNNPNFISKNSLNNKNQEQKFSDDFLFGFCHNAHSLKLLTKIELYSTKFSGLNLSWEVLEGLVKHNGPITKMGNNQQYIAKYNEIHDLNLSNYPSLEAQIAAIADDLAYNNHDLEDGLRAGLFAVEDLYDLPLVGDIYRFIVKNNPYLKRELLVNQAKQYITKHMISDVVSNSLKMLAHHHITNVEAVRKCQVALINFSDEFSEIHCSIKNFLRQRMYFHPQVNKMTSNAFMIVGKLFDFYWSSPDLLPEDLFIDYQNYCNKVNYKDLSQSALAEVIVDYIAGMTDRFAILQYEQLN